jgi:hypothetical protein
MALFLRSLSHHSVPPAIPGASQDRAPLCLGQGLTNGSVGVLEFGDLVLEAVDFLEQDGDLFGGVCVDGTDASAISPVAEAAAI